MSGLTITRQRSGWSFALGALLVLIGLVVLGNAVVATTVSVVFLGWMLLLAGIAGLVAAVVNIGSAGMWSAAIGGGVCLVVGLMCLRHTDAATVTLTLIMGALFLLSGVVRLVAAGASTEYRWPLLFGGAVSAVLGLAVLLNLFDASRALLGVMLGIQTVVEGLSMILVGRVTVVADGADELAYGRPV
jgi:membrane protein HdeD